MCDKIFYKGSQINPLNNNLSIDNPDTHMVYTTPLYFYKELQNRLTEAGFKKSCITRKNTCESEFEQLSYLEYNNKVAINNIDKKVYDDFIIYKDVESGASKSKRAGYQRFTGKQRS